MKQQVLFIHGGEAYSKYENYLAHLRSVSIDPFSEPPKRWSKTLREDLGEDFEVFLPTMPNKYNAKYQEWKVWFERHFEFLRDDVILVGWSQGGMFLAKFLIENSIPFSVKALHLVAAPFEAVNFHGEDGGDFVFDTSKIELLSKKVDAVSIWHSKDDFVVPYTHAKHYKKALPDAELITFTGRGHFLIEEFPELIERIKNL